MKSTLTICTFDSELLSIIRQRIIDAISSVNITLNKEYRLSQINTEKPVFTIELIDAKDEATPNNVRRIRKIIVKEFEALCDINDSPAFIKMNFLKVYTKMVIG